MSHDHAWTRLPDLLDDRDQPELLAHVAACHQCQRQVFLLGRVDRALRDAALPRQKAVRRARRRRWLRFSIAPIAAALAGAALLVLVLPHGEGLRQLTLRTASGRPVGRAVLARSDAENMTLAVVARGLPARGGGVYLLWAKGSGARAITVGRFMVDPTGACRARFNLPRGRSWVRFWIAPPRHPESVVATT